MTAVLAPPPAPISSAPASSSKRLVLLLMAVTSVGYVCRVAVTVVAPGMMKEFGLTQAQMGTVFSAFLVGYTFFQVPSGGLADRVSARRIFLVLCAGWALLTALTALVGWHGFGLALVIPQLWLIRALFGVVAAPTYPTSGRTLAITMPPRLQARANSLVLASVGVGSAVTPLLLAPITSHYGWRTALGIAASLSVAAGVLWWRFGPREFHSRASFKRTAAADTPALASPEVSAQPLRSRSFWFLSASYLLQGYLGYIFVFWFYLYLVQVRHFEVLKAASFTALPWIATMFAIPLGGVLSDAAVTRWGCDLGTPQRSARGPLRSGDLSGDRRSHSQCDGGRGCAHGLHRVGAVYRGTLLGDDDPTLRRAQRHRGGHNEFRQQPGRHGFARAYALVGRAHRLGNRAVADGGIGGRGRPVVAGRHRSRSPGRIRPGKGRRLARSKIASLDTAVFLQF